jgi:Ca2+-binding RTX toxin-like protein
MNSSPIANDDIVLTDEFSVTVDVLANDYDLDDDELTITNAVVSSGLGDVEFTNTDITFTPNGSNEAKITYTITDSFGHYATAVLTVNVTPTGGVNIPPIAKSDVAFTTVDQPVTVDVLANDFDADGDTLIINSIEMSANTGTVDVNENYTITFTPIAGFFGDTIITYHITDSSSASVAATLLVAVGGEMDGDEFNNTLTGSSADDILNGMEGNDKLLGNAGDDSLDGGEGNDTIMGGNGDDQLAGGEDNDVLTGGAGNDLLVGDDGSDEYIFGLGDGQDTIDNVDYDDVVNVDRLLLRVGINSTMIELQNDPDNIDDLVIAIKGTTDRVTIQDHFADESYQLDEIVFADGTVWDKAKLSHLPIMIRGEENSDDVILGFERNEVIQGLSGDDELDGSDGNDTLIGGLGNDLLMGSNGNDSYLFNLGDGQDSIDNVDDNEYSNGINSIDTLIFGLGIDSTLIELRADSDNADNLVIALLNANDTITIQNYFVDDSHKLDVIKFSDGSVLTKDNLNMMAVISRGGVDDDDLEGNDNEDVITGYQGDDVIQGMAASDTLMGNDGNDSIYGGDDNDYLDGDNGADLLEGGHGNDELHGGDGDDFLDGGDGNDSLYGDVANLGDDTLSGGNGHDSVFAGEGDDILLGGKGDDYLRGEGGSDRYIFNLGDGQDIIASFDPNLSKDSTETDELLLGAGINATDIVFSKDKVNTNDLVISIKGTNDRITVNSYFRDAHQLSRIAFADGTIWNEAQITQHIEHKKIEGTAGGDTLKGGSGDDTYSVNDVHDVVVENTNSGIDTVESSLSYILRDNLENLTLIGNAHISATGNTADNVLTGNEANNRLLGGAGNDTLYGLSGGDTLNGGEGTDTMYGGLGNDTFTVENIGDIVNESMNEGFDTVNSFISYVLTAHVERLNLEGTESLNGAGNDLDNTLNGNNANNSLVGGLGNDTLQGKGGADTLEGGLGNDLYYVDNVGDIVTELANEGTDKVSSSISFTLTEHVEQLFLTGIVGATATGNAASNIIYGNEGNNQLFGGAGNDSLNGGLGNDVLAGGVGNDTLVGGLGNDSYVFGMGLGQDTINNTDTANGHDTVLFDAGISADQLWLRQLGNDLEVSIMGTTNSVKVQNWYSNTANQLDSLQLADGKTLLANEVQTLVEAMAAFAAPALGQTSLTTAQHTALDSVIVASW